MHECVFSRPDLVNSVDGGSRWPRMQSLAGLLKRPAGRALPAQVHDPSRRAVQPRVHHPAGRSLQPARGLGSVQGPRGGLVPPELGAGLVVAVGRPGLVQALLYVRGQTLRDVLVIGGRTALVWAARNREERVAFIYSSQLLKPIKTAHQSCPKTKTLWGVRTTLMKVLIHFKAWVVQFTEIYQFPPTHLEVVSFFHLHFIFEANLFVKIILQKCTMFTVNVNCIHV